MGKFVVCIAGLILVLKEIAKLIFRVVHHFTYIPASNAYMTVSLSSCQHLVLTLFFILPILIGT